MSSLHIDTNNAGTVGAWRKSRSYDEKRSATLSCDEDVAVTHMQNHFTTTAQDLYRGENTLTCLLQGMQGIETTVELRNESTVSGKIISVDSYMNTIIGDAVFQKHLGKPQLHESFFVVGKYIRYVHIPDDMHVEGVIHERIKATRKGAATSKRKLKS
eukprot:m.162365 g.162365  ORF g.162365 m.162365 type:complete len:158 (-) comp18066_c1_seq1:292-765(-)